MNLLQQELTEGRTPLAAAKGQFRFLVGAYALAAVVYIAYGTLLSPAFGLSAGDEVEYHLLAKNLAEGKGLTYDGTEPTSFRPPLFPGLLAAVYTIFGPSYLAGRIAVALVGASLSVIIFWATMICVGDTRCARISALLAIVYYPFIKSSGLLMSDVPFMALALLFLCVFGLMLRNQERTIVLPIAGGVLLGLCLLCRPTVLLLPFWLLLLLGCVRNRKLFLRNLGIVVLFAGLTILPWTARNFFVHRQFVPVSTQGGYAFWQCHNELPPDGTIGTNPTILGNIRQVIPPLLERVKKGERAETVFQEILSWRGKAYINWLGKEGADLQEEFQGLSEVETDRLLFAKALSAIKSRPARFIRRFLKTSVKFWDPYSDPALGTSVRQYNLAYGCVLPVAFLGLAHLYRQRRLPYILLVFMLNFNFLVAVFYYEERYRLPAEACLLIFAAVGVVKLAGLRRMTCVVVLSIVIAFNVLVAVCGGGIAVVLRDFIRSL